jgi:hypothetical protein
MMSLKHTVIATLLGSALAPRSVLAQEDAAHKAEMGMEASLPSAKFTPNPVAEPPIDSAAYNEYEFIQRLAGLSRALRDFAATYKNGQVDLKQVKAVRKAMRELEKSEWFRPQKTK